MRYKTGDKVRILNNNYTGHLLDLGSTCTIVDMLQDGTIYSVKDEHGCCQSLHIREFQRADRIPCDDEQREPHTEGAI